MGVFLGDLCVCIDNFVNTLRFLKILPEILFLFVVWLGEVGRVVFCEDSAPAHVPWKAKWWMGERFFSNFGKAGIFFGYNLKKVMCGIYL